MYFSTPYDLTTLFCTSSHFVCVLEAKQNYSSFNYKMNKNSMVLMFQLLTTQCDLQCYSILHLKTNIFSNRNGRTKFMIADTATFDVYF